MVTTALDLLIAGDEVLVVDDVEANRELAAEQLRTRGYRALLASSGPQALEILANADPHLVLLDVMMPGMSGLEVLENIRETRSLVDLPVIMVSGHGETDTVVEALQLGANDFVTKPVDAQVLAARVRTQLHLKRLHDAREEFLRVASHDLKNPIARILGAARLLEGMLVTGEPVPDTMPPLATMIHRSAIDMTRIVEDFVDLNVIADGQLVLNRVACDLGSLVAATCEAQTSDAERKKIKMVLKLAPNLPTVSADPDRVGQVLQNLVGNAIKFSPLDRTVIVQTKVLHGYVRVEVCDEGPGLSSEDMEHVFEKYARLSATPTADEKSTGLGLAICKSLVELHGGDIGVSNNETVGATFFIQLIPAH